MLSHLQADYDHRQVALDKTVWHDEHGDPMTCRKTAQSAPQSWQADTALGGDAAIFACAQH